jgi:hypothetical protein
VQVSDLGESQTTRVGVWRTTRLANPDFPICDMTPSGVMRISPTVKNGTSTNFRYDVDVGKAVSTWSASGWHNLAAPRTYNKGLSDVTADVTTEYPLRETTADSTTNEEWWRASWVRIVLRRCLGLGVPWAGWIVTRTCLLDGPCTVADALGALRGGPAALCITSSRLVGSSRKAFANLTMPSTEERETPPSRRAVWVYDPFFFFFF